MIIMKSKQNKKLIKCNISLFENKNVKKLVIVKLVT